MLRKISELDLDILSYINKFSEEQYDFFWLSATNAIMWIPVFLLMFYLIYTTFNRRHVLIIVISVIITLLITILFTTLIKELVMRVRPNNNDAVSGVLRILKAPAGYSFFSGHASNSMAIATLIILVLRHRTKWVYLFYLWPLIFAFSRLYMGVHYPSDVVTGLIVGFILGLIAYRITYRRFLRADLNPA